MYPFYNKNILYVISLNQMTLILGKSIMPVELFISPPATGKTQRCIQKVQSVLSFHPLSTVWVVIPDRFQATGFHSRLAEAGWAIGVRVGTFGDLYRSIIEQTRNQIISIVSKIFCMRRLM